MTHLLGQPLHQICWQFTSIGEDREAVPGEPLAGEDMHMSIGEAAQVNGH
ncbi:MAG TPA: hypothetical protein VGP82_21945 [Ktedonobacterales bacterium]|nr:hypothetical protein [Ktedonobacterales bacterium]